MANYVMFLELLEFPYTSVSDKFLKRLHQLEVQDDIKNQFSFESLIFYALSLQSGWSVFAVKWLKQGFPLSDLIVNVLDQYKDNKNIPQKTRQDAYSIARKWEKTI